jgi:lysophospholipase L1-like esterase
LLRSCIGVLVLVGAGEGLFTYWIQEPARIPAFFRSSFLYYNDHHNTRLLQYQRDGSQYDTGLFYTLKRNSRFSFSNAEFSTGYHTNAAGLRDDSASLNYPSVICLGDSYTMGWGVEQEESFPQQLERISGRKVLNAGVSSYGTARELLLLQRLKLDSLQYLVIQYCDNDYGENKSFLDHGATLPISSKAVYDSLVTEQEWNTRYYPGKHFLLTTPLILKKAVNLLFPIFDLRQQRDILEDKPTNPYAAFYEVLARALPKNRPFTVIVLYMDSHDRVEAGSRSLSNSAKAIKRAMDSTGVEIIPFQYGHLQKDQDYFRLDLHLTASGNRKMAEWLNTVISGHPSYGH